jgi:hypothetical protein
LLLFVSQNTFEFGGKVDSLAQIQRRWDCSRSRPWRGWWCVGVARLGVASRVLDQRRAIRSIANHFPRTVSATTTTRLRALV